MKTEKDKIVRITVFDDFILILFVDGSLKKLCRKVFFDPQDEHTHNITKSNIWKTANHNEGSIFWTGYKVLDQPYAISSETAYNISKPVTKRI